MLGSTSHYDSSLSWLKLSKIVAPSLCWPGVLRISHWSNVFRGPYNIPLKIIPTRDVYPFPYHSRFIHLAVAMVTTTPFCLGAPEPKPERGYLPSVPFRPLSTSRRDRNHPIPIPDKPLMRILPEKFEPLFQPCLIFDF